MTQITMGDLFGSTNTDNSALILMMGGVAMLCCSSSAAGVYAWSQNLLCEYNESLGKSCPPAPTAAPTPDADKTPAPPAPSSGGQDDDDCDGKYKVQLGYTPKISSMTGTTKSYNVYASADATDSSGTIKMTKDFYEKCKKNYHCKVGKQLYQLRYNDNTAFNKVSKVTNYEGEPLSKDTLGGPGSSFNSGPFFNKYQMGSTLKVNNKSLTLKDVCTDCEGKCEVSIYTGIHKKQRRTYKGFEQGKKYTLKKA